MDTGVPAGPPAGTELTHLIDWLLLRGLSEEDALDCIRSMEADLRSGDAAGTNETNE